MGKGRGEKWQGQRRKGERLYPGFESDEFQDHLHGEHSGEDHVEDVHGRAKHVGLLIVLRVTRNLMYNSQGTFFL